MPDGKGRLINTNGDIYIGSFINGAQAGEDAAEQKVLISNLRKGVITHETISDCGNSNKKKIEENLY